MFTPKSWRYTVVLPHTNFPIVYPHTQALLRDCDSSLIFAGGFFCFDIPAKPVILIIMKTLKDILSNFGYITQPQLAEINEHFPHMKVVIKWGGMPRERVHVWEAIERIEKVEAEDIDYCREVFLTGRDCDNLRLALHIAN